MTMQIEFSIYMASKTRWAHLTKIISMPSVPRVGDFIKFANEEMGDYFAWQVIEVTYRESSGRFEVMTDLLDNVDERGYSFDDESEFDEYFDSYLSEGWQCERGVGPNKLHKCRAAPKEKRET
jgi:hypothetical protein